MIFRRDARMTAPSTPRFRAIAVPVALGLALALGACGGKKRPATDGAATGR